MANSPFVIDVTEANFQTEVVDRSQTVLVVIDFWAPWCGPCRTLGPVLEQLADEAGGAWILAKVNTDENPRLSQSFQIRNIPAVMAVKEGQLASQFTGAPPKAEIVKWLEQLAPAAPAAAVVTLEQARELAEQGHLDAAKAALTSLHLQEPDNIALRAALVGVESKLGNIDAALAHFHAIPEELHPLHTADIAPVFFLKRLKELPERDVLDALLVKSPLEPDALYGLAMHCAASQEYERALELLLELVRTDRAYRDDIGRLSMIEVFEVVGIHSALATTWRKRLGAIMYV